MFRTCLGLLLILAVYVGLGRLLTPLIDTQREAIIASISEMTGTVVDIDRLSGDWRHFSPILSLEGLRLQFPAAGSGGTDYHVIERLDLRLDIPASLLRRTWVIEHVSVDQLALELLETADGRWTLAGLSTGQNDYSDQVLDFLLNTASLRLDNVSLRLERNSGARVSFNDGSLQLVNQGTRHQLLIHATLEQQARPAEFVLEIDGDPRAQFSASAYFSTEQVDMAPLVPFIDVGRINIDALRSGVKLWARGDQEGIDSIQGTLSGLTALGNNGAGLGLDLSRGGVQLAASRSGSGPWEFWLSDITFDWRDRSWEPADLYLQLDNTVEERPLELLAERLDLAIASDLLLLLSDLPEAGRSALEDLSPSGFLSNVQLNTSLDGEFSDGFRLQANLDEVAVGAWQGAPSGQGISGYIEADQNSGFVELDATGFRIHLPRVFAQGWEYDSANSRINWSVSPETLRVNSSIIDVRNDDIHGRIQFDLYNTRNSEGRWDSELSLLVGVLEFDAALKNRYLPTLAGIAPTMDWLEQGLQEGDIRRSGFVFRGATHANPPDNASTVQTWFDFDDVALRFLEGWPLLEDVSGTVRVNNNDADIATETALIAGIQLNPVIARLRKNPDRPGSTLELSGTAATRSETGMAFLQTTPVRDSIGDFIDDWNAAGSLDLDLHLLVPLAEPAASPLIEVAVMSDNSRLEIPDYGLEFEELSGRINYSSETGLSASGLSARLFDYPVATGIETVSSGNDAGTWIHTTGRASSQALQDWSRQPDFVSGLLGFARGQIDYRADLRIYNGNRSDGVISTLSLESDLLGLAMDLPAPLGKGVDDSHDLALSLDFTEGNEILTTRYDSLIYSQLVLNETGLVRGLVNMGSLNRDFGIRQSASGESGLLVTGELDYFDADAWRDAAGDLQDGGGAAGSAREIIRLVDMSFGQLDVAGQSLLDINTLIRPDQEGWNLQLENERLSGTFNLSGRDDVPHRITLDYLRFPARELPEATEEPSRRPDLLAGVDPSAIPDLEFSTAEFSVGEANLGAWRFSLDSYARGAHITDFMVTMDDAVIADSTGESGASMEWQYRNRVHSTAFSGMFSAGDLAAVLPSLGYDANIESNNARFAGNLFWEGSPAAFSIVGSSGRVEIDIDDGRFVDIDSGSSRLFGAFSFDAIVRRLQLDFTDLFGRGMVFDNIDGGLMFDQGNVTTDEQILIEGPSSKITLTGEIDLVTETIQADMLVTLPLSQNISVLAGLLGAWPIAVSTYIASKIFQDQVDEFTSVVYHLEGPWENLDAGFEPPDEESGSEAEVEADAADTESGE